MNVSRPKADILIVDDTPQNLDVLSSLLQSHGYQARAAINGDIALMSLRSMLPDLILLDIRMPGLGGFDLCRLLKQDKRTREIPVIFVSALDEVTDKVEAFAAGGVDYVTKPFQAEEVIARVETHLHLRRLQRELEDKHQRLEDNYRRLVELESMRDNLTHMMAHDLRSPLMSILYRMSQIEQKLGPSLPAPERASLAAALVAARRMNEMISAMLDVSRMEAGRMPLNRERRDVAGLVDEAIEVLGGLSAGHRIQTERPAEGVCVECDGDIVRRVIINLLGNALKFTRPGTEVRIRIESREGGGARVSVQDNGPGIPAAYHEKIFEKFGQAEIFEAGQKYSTGLGLTFCKLAVESHGGRIGVNSRVGQGSTFWFDLP